MRLIDADTLIQEIKRWKEREIADGLIGKGIKAGYDAAMICVSEMPTIEERKHGHWIFTNAHYYGLDCALYYYKCSTCGELVLKDIKYGVGNYCLHCGAVMDEVAEDEVRQNKQIANYDGLFN